ncbi:MAG: transcriptional regulator [Bacilli bacterium]|jgi:TfoX/Sxy family transcriptional regulator of competence genes|nr:transcriptional regulator [Bacilli bacterium]
MASDLSFVQYVCDQLTDAGIMTFRKMFGEYMVYCNDKPIVLVCDNIAFVKMKDEITTLMNTSETGYPYQGAKLHYVLDIDNKSLATEVVKALEAITPYPKAKITKKK